MSDCEMLFPFLPSSWSFQQSSATDSEEIQWIASPCCDITPSPSLFLCGEGQALHSKNTIIRSAAQSYIQTYKRKYTLFHPPASRGMKYADEDH